MLAYLGPSGAFSHAAAKKYIKKTGIQTDIREYPSIYSAVKSVDEGINDMAIVPIENSIEGNVNVTLDSLALDVDLFIIDELILDVEQNILVKPGTKKEDISLIISHPQAIGQCSWILESKFGGCRTETYSSTSAAAKAVSEGDGSAAAIASRDSAGMYGLDILYENCGNNKNNQTRFVVIGRERCRSVTQNDKTSIVFTLRQDVPGSLCRTLLLFEEKNINLLKIESRPIKTELGKYLFFIDIEGNAENPDISSALDTISHSTDFYKFLGSYKTDR